MKTENAPTSAPVDRLVRHLRFNEVNVLAIRESRKTQTRRPLKPQPTVPDEFMEIGHWAESWATVDKRIPDDGVVDEWFSFCVGEKLSVVLPNGLATDLFIRIVRVRAERLHEITEVDAKAEGVRNDARDGRPGWIHRELFRDLWATIYGPSNQFAWEMNPWVFVYEFSVVS